MKDDEKFIKENIDLPTPGLTPPERTSTFGKYILSPILQAISIIISILLVTTVLYSTDYLVGLVVGYTSLDWRTIFRVVTNFILTFKLLYDLGVGTVLRKITGTK